MSEDYIEYWGLKNHPFLLAPDSAMMHTSGQYYECLERLKYAINTNKGGALLVSEDAGLGKTTLLLKLIDEMKAQHGNAFKYAFVNHPTLTPNQLLAFIAGCFADATPDGDGRSGSISLDFGENRRQIGLELGTNDDKLKSLMRLKESLLEVKRQGGKNIIIVDEGQMLCGARDVLQELRVLINLTYNNEYLHTFILSGQKPLWNEVKSIPELWQRLPVRYYLVSLRLDETRELIKYRLVKAGLDSQREIFTSDAFEIIQKYSMGSPRTIIALADLALLMGYADRSPRISFKELTKAINAMAGKGESLAYVKEEKPARESLTDDPVGPSREREITQERRYSPAPLSPEAPPELPVDPVSFREEKPVKEPLVDSFVVADTEQETVQEQAYSPPPPAELPPNPGSVSVEEEKATIEPLIDIIAAKPEKGQEPVQTEGGQGIQEWARSKLRELEADSIDQEPVDAAPPESEDNKRPGFMRTRIRTRLAVLTISLTVTFFVGLCYYMTSDDVKTLKTAPAKKEVFLSAGNTSAQKIREEQPLKIEPIPQEEAARQRDGEKSDKVEPTKSERETLIGKTSPVGPQAALQNRNGAKPEKETSAGKPEQLKQEETVRQRIAVRPEKGVRTKKAGPINQEKVEQNGNVDKGEKEVVVVSTTGANIRSRPDISSQRIGVFMEGEQFKVVDEKKDADGQMWYKLYVHGSRAGWVSEKAVGLK